MTTQELNRDIKKLNKAILKAEEQSNKEYYEYLEKVAKPEFLRLYGADNYFQYMNRTSILIMYRINLTHKFKPLHMFGVFIELENL